VAKKTENIKQFNLGKNYDLDLVEIYKGINPLPNLKENKNKDNEVVYILNKSGGENVVGFYLAQFRGNKTISIHASSQLDQFVGKSVLIQLFRKKLGKSYYFDNTNEIISIPQSNVLFDSAVGEELLVLKEKQQTLIQSTSLIFSYESGAIIDMQYIPIYIGINPSFKKSPKNKGYLLSMVINYGKKLNYLFINFDDNTDKRLVYFPVDLDLENAIGQYFTFESFPLSSAINVQSLTDNTTSPVYILETILNNNLYIFSKDTQKYFVEIKGFDLGSHNIGKLFSLGLIPIIRGTTIDFESAY
jgi:hypothetical protein